MLGTCSSKFFTSQRIKELCEIVAGSLKINVNYILVLKNFPPFYFFISMVDIPVESPFVRGLNEIRFSKIENRAKIMDFSIILPILNEK